MAARGLVPLVSGVALQQMLMNRIESLPQTDNQRYQILVISHLLANCDGLGQIEMVHMVTRTLESLVNVFLTVHKFDEQF